MCLQNQPISKLSCGRIEKKILGGGGKSGKVKRKERNKGRKVGVGVMVKEVRKEGKKKGGK